MIRTAGIGFSLFVAGLLTVAGMAGFAGDSQAASSPASNDKATSQLFQAVYANDLPSVQVSVGDGADVDARDRWGMTPADIAIDRGNYRIAHFLVSIRNTRRTQEALAAATAASPAAKAESAVPVAAGKHPTTATGPATAVARRAEPAASPASASIPATAQLTGPNPFDPATPAPGSQLLGATASADSR